jgi:flagellar protein FliO/FliZ
MKPKTLFIAAATACPLLLIRASSALAAAPAGENTPVNLGGGTTGSSAHVPGAGGGSLVRTFVGLAIVIGVIWGLYWVLKQVKSSREEKSSGRGLSQIASLPLAANRSLQLVRAGRQLVLVGVSEHGVTPVRTYSEEEAEAAGLLELEDEESWQAADRGPQGRGMGLGRLVDELRKRSVRR